MRYASVCDGIGAVHVAWQPLGWECAWTSEIEAFPAAVVEQRYGYRNLGDMTKLTEEQLDGCGPVSLLCGGTPCQSFSVAGLRKGLADPRGNLALRFVQLVGVLRPTWVVWENVPGVLSSAGGRDFGTFLGALGELGYGFAYRVLDAQWFGVAQRRRRVFVVAHARDWRRAAAVLFERESLFGDPPTRGEAGEGTAVSPALRARANSSHRADTQAYVPEVSPALKARDFKGPSSDGDGDGASLVPVTQSFYSTESRCDNLPPPDVAPPLKVGSNGGGQPPAVAMPAVAHALRADGFDASEDGTGRGTPLVPVAIRTAQTSANGHGLAEDVAHTLDQVQGQAVAFDTTQITSKLNRSSPKPGDPCHPLAAGAHPPAIAFDILGTPATNAAKQTDVHVALRSRTPGQSEASTTTVVMEGVDFQNCATTGDVSGTLMGEAQKKGGEAGHGVAVAFAQNQVGEVRTNSDVMGTVNTNQNASGRNTPMVMTPMAVRRLTPRECERLQGFPEVVESVTIDVCIDLQSRCVLAAIQCRRWLNGACNADDERLSGNACLADERLSASHLGSVPLAAVSVLTNYESRIQAVRSRGKLIWSASSVDESDKFLQALKKGSIAERLAQGVRFLVAETRDGKAESRLLISRSTQASLGSKPATKCGEEIQGLAGDVSADASLARFTTSDLGRLTPAIDCELAISACSVFAAISGCIPSETLPESFSIRIDVQSPYTLVTYRGKPAADGPRYKALGNSMAVPVMAWIGRRIAEVEVLP